MILRNEFQFLAETKFYPHYSMRTVLLFHFGRPLSTSVTPASSGFRTLPRGAAGPNGGAGRRVRLREVNADAARLALLRLLRRRVSIGWSVEQGAER